VEIDTELSTLHVVRIQGLLLHNDTCQQAALDRFPMLKLHPSVYEIALQQLHDGAR
jgi:hypothetical protein